MKRFLKSKKGLALLATLVVAAAAAVGAYAYFSSSGSDSSQTATVGNASQFTVANLEKASQPDLFPTTGDAPNDAYDWSVTNNDPGVDHYASITASIDPTFSHTTGANPACTAADFSLSTDGTNWSASSVQLESAGSLNGVGDYVNGTFFVQLTDNGANQDSCQGQTPTIVVSVS